MPLENFVSCDTKGVAKPALAAYRSMLQKFADDDVKWFAAAHMWDVSAAVKAGFTGAYCSVLEKEPATEIFDVKINVIASSLPQMARGIVESSS